MKRIIVDKTIYNNDIETLSYLAYIQEQIFTIINLGAKMADEVDIEFKNCKYIDPTVLPLIGSIGDLLGDNGFHGKLRFQDSDESVLKYIKDSGLFTHYTNTGRADPNAIPFSICSTLDASSDIIDMFIEKAPVNLSQSAQDALSSIILAKLKEVAIQNANKLISQVAPNIANPFEGTIFQDTFASMTNVSGWMQEAAGQAIDNPFKKLEKDLEA